MPLVNLVDLSVVLHHTVFVMWIAVNVGIKMPLHAMDLIQN